MKYAAAVLALALLTAPGLAELREPRDAIKIRSILSQEGEETITYSAAEWVLDCGWTQADLPSSPGYDAEACDMDCEAAEAMLPRGGTTGCCPTFCPTSEPQFPVKPACLCVAGVLFYDGFESGDLEFWDPGEEV